MRRFWAMLSAKAFRDGNGGPHPHVATSSLGVSGATTLAQLLNLFLVG